MLFGEQPGGATQRCTMSASRQRVTLRVRRSTHFHPMGIQSALTSDLRAAQSVERYLNGDRVALPSYASWVNKNFAEYLLIRNRFYRRELRWPRSLFWQRRQIEMPAS